MDARNIARMEAGDRVVVFNIVPANLAQLTTMNNYPIVSNGITTTLQKIKDAYTAQSKDISGLTPTKQQLRVAMGDTLLIYNQRAWVDAKLANNTELAEELEHVITYYTIGKVSLGVSRANASAKLLNDNLDVFTSLQASDIVIVKAAITAFTSYKDNPTTEKQAKKVAGTNQFDPLLDTLDEFISLEAGLIHSYFPKSKLAEGFDLTSKIIILGVRHSPVLVHMENALTGEAIVGGILTKMATGKTAISDETGLAQFDTSVAGKPKFRVEAAGYVTQEITAIVRRGIGVELVVKMVKA